MKYLDTYKIFESARFNTSNNQKDELEVQIGDILADIKDDGFDYLVFINNAGSFGLTPVSVNIFLPSNDADRLGQVFTYDKIKNGVSHLISFLKEKKYKLADISIVTSSGKPTENLNNYFGLDINIPDDKDIKVLKLTFEIEFQSSWC